MKIAVEGCCHGELENTYAHLARLERAHGYTVDVLLVCGDFQAVRNHADLSCMAVPPKYRRLGGFHKYYVGEATAPVLTLVVGGNHEASNYMWELYHGGWLAPNIYFLGCAGCVRVGGVRIAGASGIYKAGDYTCGHHEALPYDAASVRSVYHVRQYDIFKLAQLSPPDIFLSHDWPNTIERHGDTQALLRRKPFFRQEAHDGTLGSPPLLALLKTLRPRWWFSAHLHVRFEAVYRHDAGAAPPRAHNPDEIVVDDVLDDDDDAAAAPPARASPAAPAPPAETRFLALDKCLPKREFLEVIDVPGAAPPRLTFDPEWLAITRALHPHLSTARRQPPLPAAADARALVARELAWVRAHVAHGGMPPIGAVQTFARTAPGPAQGPAQAQAPAWYTNPQTEALAQMLQIANKINPAPAEMELMAGPRAGPHPHPPPHPGAAPPPDVIDAAEDAEGPVVLPVPDAGHWSPSRMVE